MRCHVTGVSPATRSSYRAFNLNTWLAQHGYLAGKSSWEGKVSLLDNAEDVARTLAGMFGATAGTAQSGLRQNFSFGPRTPLNVPIDGARGFAAVSIALDTLKQQIAPLNSAGHTPSGTKAPPVMAAHPVPWLYS